MRLTRRQCHQRKWNSRSRQGGGKQILSKRVNSAKLKSSQKGSGTGLFLSVSVPNEGQPGVGHEGEGHVTIPAVPIADFVLAETGHTFGFLKQMFHVIAA